MSLTNDNDKKLKNYPTNFLQVLVELLQQFSLEFSITPESIADALGYVPSAVFANEIQADGSDTYIRSWLVEVEILTVMAGMHPVKKAERTHDAVTGTIVFTGQVDADNVIIITYKKA